MFFFRDIVFFFIFLSTVPAQNSKCENAPERCQALILELSAYLCYPLNRKRCLLVTDTPKQSSPFQWWMLPKLALLLRALPILRLRQDRHFYFFLLSLLSRKVRNATIRLPKEISKPIIPINIKMISAAVILRTSLPMYSGKPVTGSGGCHPVMGTLP